MRKITASMLLGLISVTVFSPSVAAKTVFSTKPHCFRMGQFVAGGWNGNLKIQLQRALTDHAGAAVGVVANIHGFKSVTPPMDYYQPLVGSAGYVGPGDSELISNGVQITLSGTSFGTDTTDAGEVEGTWTRNNVLMLAPETKGRALDGRLLGTKAFAPLSTGVIQPSVNINKTVTEISCSDF